MPRRSVLSDSEKQSLLGIPTDLAELSKYYLLSEADISLIDQKRGKHNKLGFALLLCCMRYPGLSFDSETDIQPETLKFIANQLKIKDFSVWRNYFKRDSTRREHILELQSLFGFKTFTNLHYEDYIKKLTPLAKQNDKGIIVANQLITLLHMDKIIVPSISVIERLCAEAITNGNQELYSDLVAPLSDIHIFEFDELLKLKSETRISNLHWLLQPATIPKPKHILLHIERLKLINKLNLPSNISKNVHQNRLIRIAKEGKNMPAGEIQKFEPSRRYATLVAVVIETKASIIDEIIELNDKILGNIFNKAKHSHNNEFQNSSKTINEKLNLYVKIGQILITAKQNNEDPFQAIEAVIPWDDFTKSVNDTKELAKPDSFDSLYKITAYYSWIKRYMIEFLEALEFKPSNSTTELFKALGIVKQMHHGKLRKVPDKAPTIFIKKQWHNLVFKDNNAIDKQFYEFAVLTELKNSLRSGDIWVVGSRKHKDFDEYLLDKEVFKQKRLESTLRTVGSCSFKEFITSRADILKANLKEVHELVLKDELHDATINDDGLKITPLTNSVPEEAYAFNQKVYALLPKIKITTLLQEVDTWENYTQHFIHLKNEKPAGNKQLLLTVVGVPLDIM